MTSLTPPPSPLEEEVVAHAATGEELDCGEGEVRTEVVYALCVGTVAEWPVHPRGVRLTRATIGGPLDLEGATLRCPLSLTNCVFEEPVVLTQARAKTIRLSDSQLPRLVADGLETDGNLYLSRSFNAPGGVSLVAATINGLLQCAGARFGNGGGAALSADRLVTTGGVFLRNGFTADGEVSLLGADVGGNVDCTAASFDGRGAAALSMDGITVKGNVFLRFGTYSDGGVAVRRRFEARGEVRLPGATVHGQFSCRGGRFETPGNRAINASGLVAGSVVLSDGFEAFGLVELIAAELRSLECPGGSFRDGKEGLVIQGDGLSVKGLVMLDGCHAAGEVRLLGTHVGGQLSFRNATLYNPAQIALRGDGLSTTADLLLDDGFRADGELSLVGAQIGGRLVCSGSTFSNPGKVAFNGEAMNVAGAFAWNRLASRPVGKVDLSYATVGRLEDDTGSWPEPKNLLIAGFTYRTLGRAAPDSPSQRLDWLRRAPFSRQPFEQLVGVYRDSGHEAEARAIAIGAQEDARTRGGLAWPSRTWNWFLGKTIAHGYKPWLALRPFAVLIVVATFVFAWAASREIIVVKKAEKERPVAVGNCTKAYPCFRALPYSLDVALPILDLEQENAWRVDASKRWGWPVRVFQWITLIAGWALATTAIAGLTGLVRKI